MKLLILALGLILAWNSSFAEGKLKVYQGATPALELSDLQGNSHNIDSYTGKVLMVQFWATYCTPCRTEMPSMNKLAKKLGNRFKILAVNMGEPTDEVQKFVDEVKPDFTMLLDPAGRSIQEWRVFAVPSTFIIDGRGKIRYTLYGPAKWDTEEMVETLTALYE